MKNKTKIFIMIIILSFFLILTSCNKTDHDYDEESNTPKLEYKLNEDEESYSVIGIGTVKDKNIIIPDKYKNLPVTKIESKAFYQNTNIESITIPQSIIEIGVDAFAECSNLTYNTYDNGLYLGNALNPYLVLVTPFSKNITRINIHDSTTIILDSAFSGCTNLRNITIPQSIIEIGVDAFAECNKLTYNTYDNGLYLGNALNPYLVFAKTVSKDIEEIKIHDSTTMILGSAFSGCTNLTSITIPDSVISIGDSAFYNCTSLKNIKLSSNIKKIAAYTFAECSSLTIIEIPGKVEEIGLEAFDGCMNLFNIKLPSSLVAINEYAFKRCEYLYNVYFDGTIEDWLEIYFDNELSTPMGYAKFLYIKDDKNIYSEVTEVVIPSSITNIRKYQFFGFNNLKKVTIENGIQQICEGAFSYCQALTSIEIPQSVNIIEAKAFEYCSNLRHIEILNPSIKIAEKVFFSCYKLESIKLPSNLTSIENGMFYHCGSLTSIEIPSSVTNIGENVFRECTSLTDVYYNGTIEDWCNIKFENSTPMEYAKRIYMKDSKGIYYEVTEIIIPNTITNIGNCQFRGFDNITKVTIPDSVTSIGKAAFASCTNLTDIRFSESLISIGVSAFNGCKKLTNIELPDNIVSIGSYAFCDCTNLKKIIIPETVSFIDNKPFILCYNLTIYCKAKSLPSDWHQNWNDGDCPVVWGYRE